MIFSEDKYRFMHAALQEAIKAKEENEVPVGAVIVYQNRIISRGYNQIIKLSDPTAHAEMIAITSASNHLNNWRLEGSSIYITVEPCIMCTGAILNARIDEIYFGCYDTKFGACGSIYNLPEEKKSNHHPKVYSGLLATESESLMKDFFNNLRNKPSKSEIT